MAVLLFGKHLCTRVYCKTCDARGHVKRDTIFFTNLNGHMKNYCSKNRCHDAMLCDTLLLISCVTNSFMFEVNRIRHKIKFNFLPVTNIIVLWRIFTLFLHLCVMYKPQFKEKKLVLLSNFNLDPIHAIARWSRAQLWDWKQKRTSCGIVGKSVTVG